MIAVPLAALLLLNRVAVAIDIVDEPWASRMKANKFGLGPAPFPHHRQMDFELFGSARTTRDSVSLTALKQHQKGAIWSKRPVVQQAREWQADLVFRVGGSPNKQYFGDGFAFWLAKERGVAGDASGGPDKWTGLGVFFDTFKNDRFKGKRHPYVYGKVSNGDFHFKDISARRVEGCHIPFRSDDPSVLLTTVARMTYKDRIVSVVMQPQGSVDWVQCFEIRNVDLPVGAYFGVTAMTGDLIDQHDMLEINVYSNIEHQPFEYAHGNDIKQMPDMWTDMGYSGDVAREFEQWEKELEEELKYDIKQDRRQKWGIGKRGRKRNEEQKAPPKKGWFSGLKNAVMGGSDSKKSPTPPGRKPKRPQRRPPKRVVEEEDTDGDYGDYGEARDAYGSDDDSEEESPYGAYGNESEDPYAADDDDDVDLDDISLSEEEKAHINDLTKDSDLALKIIAMQTENEDKIKQSDKVTDMIRKMRRAEYSYNQRVRELGRRLNVHLDNFEDQNKRNGKWYLTLCVMHQCGGGWTWAFVILLVLIGSFFGVGYSKYNSYMKTHLL